MLFNFINHIMRGEGSAPLLCRVVWRCKTALLMNSRPPFWHCG